MSDSTDKNIDDNNLPAGGDLGEEANPAPASNWYDSLGDDLKTNPNITKHKDVGGLAKAYVEATKKIGQKGLAPLPSDATAEQRAAYNALRRGESIKAPTDYSWGKDMDDAGVTALKTALFNAGADDYMASEVLGAIQSADAAEGARQEEYAARYYEGEAEKLRREWGEDYAVNQKANDLLLSKYPEAAKVVKALGVDKVAGFQLMLHHLNSLARDGQIKIEAARDKTLDEQIKAIEDSEAFKQSWHKDHEKAKRERARLIVSMTQNR